jgi:hypothetical protein
MRKLGLMVAGAMVLALAASCTEQTGSTEPGRSALNPVDPRRNTAVTGAGFTTVDEDVDGTGHCKNGNPNVNCNIYDGKQYVWLNGGPVAGGVGDGNYFFAVLDPGGQGGNQNPNDGTPKNLSDGANGDYTSRTFTVSGGTITYTGSPALHDYDAVNHKIRLALYDNTTNPGGVYIMAICSLADGYPVNPSDCKYDAFKIKEACVDCGGGHQPEDLTVVKDADGSDTKTWTWHIAKAADKTKITKVNGTATFNYTVTVNHDASGVISDVKVAGTISVFNSNVDDAFATVPVSGVDITDELSDGTTCSVTGGSNATLPDFVNTYAYSCTLSALPQGQLDNTVTVKWGAQDLANGATLAAGTAQFGFSDISFTEDVIDETIDVTDTYAGTLGTVSIGDPNPTEFKYSRDVPIPAHGCTTVGNTATFTTNDTETQGTASAEVQACRVPPVTGALTIGFWQNKNGQGIITGQAKTGVCASATWLRQYSPFLDLPATATCAQVGTYVTNVIKAANSAGTSMNPMLKAQMLATALDVYFSDAALGGNKIKAPGALGPVMIDLTQICKMIDGGGGGSCNGTYQNVSSAFGGATSLSVSQILAYAASQSNAGGSNWYGQVKATQELAKNTFDAINNEVAFQAP